MGYGRVESNGQYADWLVHFHKCSMLVQTMMVTERTKVDEEQEFPIYA